MQVCKECGDVADVLLHDLCECCAEDAAHTKRISIRFRKYDHGDVRSDQEGEQYDYS